MVDRTYTVSEVLLRRMKGRYGEVFHCAKCEKPFIIGDEVQPKLKGGGSKWFHAACLRQ